MKIIQLSGDMPPCGKTSGDVFRGLDVFQQYDMRDTFSLANRLQQYRSCKAFEVTYLLRSISRPHRIQVKVALPEGGEVDSAAGLWKSADWHERET